MQLLALLQPVAAAACNCRAESYCVSCGVLPDGSSSLLHSVCLSVYLQPNQITQAAKMAMVSPVACDAGFVSLGYNSCLVGDSCRFMYEPPRQADFVHWPCRPLTAFRILVFLVFTTFQTSFLLLFTVTWTCPIIGKRVDKQLSYFPGVCEFLPLISRTVISCNASTDHDAHN